MISRHILNVANVDLLTSFYTEHLGMVALKPSDKPVEEDGLRRVLLGYGQDPDAGTWIDLRQKTGHVDGDSCYRHRDSDVYWKIGITHPDLGMAARRLQVRGIAVTTPHQFGDIGYMCHLEDPEGFKIELLQHHFETNQRPVAEDKGHPLGASATLAQLTIRVKEIDRSLHFYRDMLGMKLLSVQPVADFGFTLYFLADTTDSPPDPDVTAVGNREWLWQRPYTTLELQHRWSSGQEDAKLALLPKDGVGFAGFTFVTPEFEALSLRLTDQGFSSEMIVGGHGLATKDPEGIPIQIRSA